MTDRQENRLSMYLVVRKVCDEFSSAWSPIPAFGTAFAKFTDNLTNISLAVQQQTAAITGFAKDKLEEKEEMVVKTVQVASAAFAYARSINDQAMADSVNFKPAKLRGLRDSTLKDVCTKISEIANANIAALADFGIAPADITQLQSEIADFEKFLAAPREAIGGRVFSTTDLTKLFRNTDLILKDQLDRLISQFEYTNKRFFIRYKNARKIIDLGVRHIKEEEPIK